MPSSRRKEIGSPASVSVKPAAPMAIPPASKSTVSGTNPPGMARAMSGARNITVAIKNSAPKASPSMFPPI